MSTSEKTASDADDIRAQLPATLESIYEKYRDLDEGKEIEELTNRYSLHYLEAVFRGNILGRAVQEPSG